jgi:hypothetical protein
MKINEYSKTDLLQLINCSDSYKNFLSKLGYSSSGNAYRHTKKYLDSVGVDYSKLTKDKWSSKEKSIEEVFISGINFCNKSLKIKILKYGLLDYVCVICDNNGEWMGEKLSLHLDHINGDSTDNRIENLRFLCPNCHSQTETYAGKNNKNTFPSSNG